MNFAIKSGQEYIKTRGFYYLVHIDITSSSITNGETGNRKKRFRYEAWWYRSKV